MDDIVRFLYKHLGDERMKRERQRLARFDLDSPEFADQLMALTREAMERKQQGLAA